MVCGTTSDAGKTTLVAGLCRSLARNGVRVAPFKSQNMALNSAVTMSGHEIGRAQYLQAEAAGIEPEVAFNPILLKPTSERASQVVVMGKSIGVMSAVEYHAAKPELFDLVSNALAELRSRFDVVLVEGAGSPAEINLLSHDIVNLRLAERAKIQAIVVGDIDPGGVFASLFGTVALLPPNLAALVSGFVINKFRGDPALLLDGTDQLQDRSGIPTLGVVPMIERLRLDAEDSLALAHLPAQSPTAALDIAVIAFPRISNFTDLDPLLMEEDAAVRFVHNANELGSPDLLILPGSKSTVDDLAWLSARRLDIAICRLGNKTTIVGICGGYQMLGQSIEDGVESAKTHASGLGLLNVKTKFEASKVLSRVSGRCNQMKLTGYQIHQGRVSLNPSTQTWFQLEDGRPEGARNSSVFGTTIHGLFDGDEFRRSFLNDVAERSSNRFRATDLSTTSLRDSELDRLADHLEEHLDMPAIYNLIGRSK